MSNRGIEAGSLAPVSDKTTMEGLSDFALPYGVINPREWYASPDFLEADIGTTSRFQPAMEIVQPKHYGVTGDLMLGGRSPVRRKMEG
jgi:hypothetical protein